ncbi:hypothetical protein SUGI_0561250 [Cryptomeria japonica]|nr:hypothetical protein SUGI_0561250 [Cryptomeria japonica]
MEMGNLQHSTCSDLGFHIGAPASPPLPLKLDLLPKPPLHHASPSLVTLPRAQKFSITADENSEVCSPNSLDLNKPLPSNEVGDFEKHFNVENGSLRNNNEKEKDGIKRRLKLSGEQYAYLEGCFKQNTNVDDEALAKELNISPRQVYVWFQNIKARNKSKQIKTHCNLWKRYNKALREENKSLRKKLAEISALKQAQETPSLKLGL